MTSSYSRHKQIKKTNHLQCWTDKTTCRFPCPKCKKTGHSAIFISPENLLRHLYQSHSFDKNNYPSIVFVVGVLEKISIALQNKKSLEKITEAVELGLVIK